MSGLKLSSAILGAATALSLCALPTAALAKKDRKDRMAAEETPCPVNTPILVSSSEITNRFSVLTQCAPQVIEAIATPEDFKHDGTFVIGADGNEYSAGSTVAGLDGDSSGGGSVTIEKKQEAGVRYTRIVPPNTPAASYDDPALYGAPSAPYYAPYSGGAAGGSGMTIASSGAAAVGQMAPASMGASPEAERILSLRPRSYASRYDNMIEQAARRHGVDPLMLHSVIHQESRYKEGARSHVGARGIMQIMPGTGKQLGVSNANHLYDPATNINAGAKLLKQLWTQYNGRFDLVLAAYNAGPGAVAKYGNTVPPYRETRDYVVKVQGHYKKLAAENGMSPGF